MATPSPKKKQENFSLESPSTVFENHRKSLIQHCERSELRLHFSGQKLIKNAKNGLFWRFFENLKLAVKQCYQTGQKLVENAKIGKFPLRHFG